MAGSPSASTAAGLRIRLLPGLLIVAILLLTRFGVPLVVAGPAGGYVAVLGGLAGGLAVMVWWLVFSRAPWVDRLGALALMVAALAVTPLVLHPSIATGMMGLMFFVYAVPVVSGAFVASVAAGRALADGPRRALMAAGIVAGCGMFALLRSDGITGGGAAQFAWRWSPTAEERLLARAELPAAPAPAAPKREEAPAVPPVAETGAPVAETSSPAAPDAAPARAAAAPAAEASAASASVPPAAWPGFRGAARSGRVEGIRIGTDWQASPPVELWRRPIGPGWSSFAVAGDRIYTQEQRGEDEVVASYDARTGEPVWAHRDTVRFWEANGGAGPRATPAVSGGRVYAFGATGVLNALRAADGSVIWSRRAVDDTGASVPYWGFASSPLVLDDLVIVYAGALAAYDRDSGARRWVGPVQGDSYSSPQLVTIDGVEQIVQLTPEGAVGVAPADGGVLWTHAWPGFTIVQPALTADRGLLITTSGQGGGGLGLRRLALDRSADGWTVTERWTSTGLKPYFNDFVVHEGHAYGFDGRILSCVNLADGTRMWKGGRYGNGQMLLLPEQDLLLVLSEDGEIALVGATPGGFTELARVPALDGKTWNHPVLAGDRLFTRNGTEMAAFRLPSAP
jgi:outer membrane protein assembly factor BamB